MKSRKILHIDANNFFVGCEILANPDLKGKEIMSAIGDAWNKLSDKQKEKYHEMAAKDKERYEKECNEKGIEPKAAGKKKKGGQKVDKQKKTKKDESSMDEGSDEDDD